MKQTIIILFAVMVATTFSQLSSEKQVSRLFSAEGKHISVYTTASGTEMRLSYSGTLPFENAVQPMESEVAIFINPAKQFQSFLGIGGAITDADYAVS